MKRVLVVTFAALACSKAAPDVRDAGAEQGSLDAEGSVVDAQISLAVDFSVENCPSFDAQVPSCTGKAPLSVRFVPLAVTTVTQYFWNFGDSASAIELAPSHTYTTPGVYPVTVVATGVSGKVVTKIRDAFIVVQPNPIGDPCTSSVQCVQGLFCLCPATAPCATGPVHGLCAASCQQTGTCGDTQACAGLLTATPPAGKASAWQAPTCLRGCARDTDCSVGLHCRTLPPGPVGSAWIRGCFADVPADVGSPCRDDEGNLRDDLCASGLCADLGANGLCSMTCGAASCPPGTDCAVFGDGRRLCLRPCTSFACDQDPLLTCVFPGSGALGYQLVNPTNPGAASSYCAPTPCFKDSDCKSPTGSCVTGTGPGHCVLRSG
jgi:PKD repeat protein